MRPARPGLLVSVRSPEEAEAALAGGAALIDVKEPRHGPLGRADDDVIFDVVTTVAGRCPVSAALGELVDDPGNIPDYGLSYVKWGLSGCGPNWRDLLPARTQPAPRLVLTAYADWQCAGSPPPQEVLDVALSRPGTAFLIDTCCKDAQARLGRRPTLLDWLSVSEIEELCRQARLGDVPIALAGSLGRDEIAALKDAAPSWFAVRGAACRRRDRESIVDAQQVSILVAAL